MKYCQSYGQVASEALQPSLSNPSCGVLLSPMPPLLAKGPPAQEPMQPIAPIADLVKSNVRDRRSRLVERMEARRRTQRR